MTAVINRASTAWLVSGLLLVVAGALTAISHLVFWWPCVGSGVGSDVCAQRSAVWLSPPYMADPPNRLPWVTGSAAVGSLLAGLSWPMAMRTMRLGRGGRILGLLLAVQTVSIGVWSVVSAFTPLIDPELPVSRLWWVSGELLAAALVLAMTVEQAEQEERTRAQLGWAVVVLVGATTFGLLRWIAELLAFGGSLGKGEPAPGAGLGLAITLTLCGGALLVHWGLLERGLDSGLLARRSRWRSRWPTGAR